MLIVLNLTFFLNALLFHGYCLISSEIQYETSLASLVWLTDTVLSFRHRYGWPLCFWYMKLTLLSKGIFIWKGLFLFSWFSCVRVYFCNFDFSSEPISQNVQFIFISQNILICTNCQKCTYFSLFFKTVKGDVCKVSCVV